MLRAVTEGKTPRAFPSEGAFPVYARLPSRRAASSRPQQAPEISGDACDRAFAKSVDGPPCVDRNGSLAMLQPQSELRR